MPRHSVRNSISKPFLPIKRALSSRRERGISSDSIHVQLAQALLAGGESPECWRDEPLTQKAEKAEVPAAALEVAQTLLAERDVLHTRRKSTSGLAFVPDAQTGTANSASGRARRSASLSIVPPSRLRVAAEGQAGLQKGKAPHAPETRVVSAHSPIEMRGAPAPFTQPPASPRSDSEARSRHISMPQSRSIAPVPQKSVVADDSAPHARTGKAASTSKTSPPDQPIKRFSFPFVHSARQGGLSPVLEADDWSHEEPWEYLKIRRRGPDGQFVPRLGDPDFVELPPSDSTRDWQFIKVAPARQRSQRKRTPSVPLQHAKRLFQLPLRSQASTEKAHPSRSDPRRRSVSANDALPGASKPSRWRKTFERSAIHSQNWPAVEGGIKHLVPDGLPRSPTAGLQAWSSSLQTDLDFSYTTNGGHNSWLSALAEQRALAASSTAADDSGVGMLSFSLADTSIAEEDEDAEEYDENGELLPPRYLLPFISRSGSNWQNAGATGTVGRLKVSTSRQSHLRRVSCPEILLTPSDSSFLEPTTLFKPAEQVAELPRNAEVVESFMACSSVPDSSSHSKRPLHPPPEALFGPLLHRRSFSSAIDDDATIRPTRARAVKRVSFSSAPSERGAMSTSSSYVFPVTEEGFASRTKLELRPRDLNTDLEVRPWMVVAPKFVLEDCGVGVRDWDRDRQDTTGSF